MNFHFGGKKPLCLPHIRCQVEKDQKAIYFKKNTKTFKGKYKRSFYFVFMTLKQANTEVLTMKTKH